MPLIKPGHWPDTYWPDRYWMADYWPEYGREIPPRPINRDCPSPPLIGEDITPEGVADALACRTIQPWDHRKRDLW